jgi:hypothetical protein
MVYNTQNYWVLGLCPPSDILETRKHNVSETGSVSVFRWGGGPGYGSPSLPDPTRPPRNRKPQNLWGSTKTPGLPTQLMVCHVSSPNPFTSHGRETPDHVPKSFLVVEQVQEDMSAAVHAGDIGVFWVTYVSDQHSSADISYSLHIFQVLWYKVLCDTCPKKPVEFGGTSCNSTGDFDGGGSLHFSGTACQKWH